MASPMKKRLIFYAGLVLLSLVLCRCGVMQRPLLFFPTHRAINNTMAEWRHEGELMGFVREAKDPQGVWLMLHGNGGQAENRWVAMDAFSPRDVVYVLEYPGYGERSGMPSRRSFDAAAIEAYEWLRAKYPGKRIGVVSESIGSGPACVLANQSPPPDKLVLIVPFDVMRNVAKRHFPGLVVSLVLEADWNNIEALRAYRGPVEVFAAEQDQVIPMAHARNLADHVKQAVFHSLPGGHNEWLDSGKVVIRFDEEVASGR